MFTRAYSEIETLWSEIAENGWDLFAHLSWHFFLVDTRREGLERMWFRLERLGYRVREWNGPEDGWLLVVERVERMNPQQLHAYVVELIDMCEEFGVEGLDCVDPDHIDTP